MIIHHKRQKLVHLCWLESLSLTVNWTTPSCTNLYWLIGIKTYVGGLMWNGCCSLMRKISWFSLSSSALSLSCTTTHQLDYNKLSQTVNYMLLTTESATRLQLLTFCHTHRTGLVMTAEPTLELIHTETHARWCDNIRNVMGTDCLHVSKTDNSYSLVARDIERLAYNVQLPCQVILFLQDLDSFFEMQL